MISKKQIVLLFCIVSTLSSCIVANIFSKRTLPDFSDIIMNENIDDISLTIYYMSPYILADIPLTVDDVINSNSEYINKIAISGSALKEHIDLFKRIRDDNIIIVRKKSDYVDIRMYYLLESQKNGKLLDVAFWGDDSNILVNGIEVKENNIYYDAVLPFLPQNEAQEWKDFIDNKKTFN